MEGGRGSGAAEREGDAEAQGEIEVVADAEVHHRLETRRDERIRPLRRRRPAPFGAPGTAHIREAAARQAAQRQREEPVATFDQGDGEPHLERPGGGAAAPLRPRGKAAYRKRRGPSGG